MVVEIDACPAALGSVDSSTFDGSELVIVTLSDPELLWYTVVAACRFLPMVTFAKGTFIGSGGLLTFIVKERDCCPVYPGGASAEIVTVPSPTGFSATLITLAAVASVATAPTVATV